MNPSIGPNTPAVPTPAPAAQYEFNAEQNGVIDELADALGWVRVPLLLIALGYGLSSIGHFARVGKDTAELLPAGLALLSAVFFLLLSSWLDKAAVAFSRVTHTSGYDITHLMTALRQLRRTFGLVAALIQVFILAFFALLVVALVVALSRGDW